MSLAEVACGYATILLNDDGIAITADNIATVIEAAGITVESFWPALFAKLAERRSISDLISTVGAGGGGGAVAAAAAPTGGAPAGGASAAPPPEEDKKKKEEPEEESDDDMGFSLFD